MVLTRSTTRLLTIGGLVGPLLWLVAVIYSGAIFPGYSHIHQYISELAAYGSPTQRVMQVTGFVLPGLLVAGFGLSIGLSTSEKLLGFGACLIALSGTLRVVAGLLPCDAGCGRLSSSAGQAMHNLAGTTFVLTAIAAAAVWIVISGRRPGRSIWFSAFSLLTVVVAIGVAPLLMRSGIAKGTEVGLFQRVTLGAVNLWIVTLAARRLAEGRRERDAVSRRVTVSAS